MMKFRTRLGVAAIAAGAVITIAFAAQAADVVRIGVPTKTYWPTILITAGIERGIFAKEGLEAEMTVYRGGGETFRSEEHTSELQSLMRISYAVLSLKKTTESKSIMLHTYLI